MFVNDVAPSGSPALRRQRTRHRGLPDTYCTRGEVKTAGRVLHCPAPVVTYLREPGPVSGDLDQQFQIFSIFGVIGERSPKVEAAQLFELYQPGLLNLIRGYLVPSQHDQRMLVDLLVRDSATKEYVTRRQAEGKNRKEIIRCPKRHIAPQIYRLLTNPPPTPNCARLRARRRNAGITITQAAQALRTHTARISELERGLHHNHQLATRYQTWLRTREPAPSPI